MTLPPPMPGTARQGPSNLGYDPFDWNSYPYGMSLDSLVLEPSTLDVAPELDPIETISNFLNYDNDGPGEYRMLDMACRLFAKLTHEAAYHDLPAADIFAACCHTAGIWERG